MQNKLKVAIYSTRTQAGAGLGSTLSVIPVYSFQKSLSQFTLSVQITCVRILSECEHAVYILRVRTSLNFKARPAAGITAHDAYMNSVGFNFSTYKANLYGSHAISMPQVNNVVHSPALVHRCTS